MFRFTSKRNKAKRSSSLFFVFSLFSHLFLLFSAFFHLLFAYFTFIFASDFWCFTSKWIMWYQAFFSLRSQTKFSLQFQILLPKRKWGRTLVRRLEGWPNMTQEVWFCTWWTGRTAYLFRTVPVALTGAALLLADGISSWCFTVS